MQKGKWTGMCGEFAGDERATLAAGDGSDFYERHFWSRALRRLSVTMNFEDALR